MNVNVQGKAVKLPDFFLIGAAKCGTTSLYYYLRQHPRIFFPVRKEPFYFSFSDRPPHERDSDLKGARGRNVVWKFDEYVRLFRAAGDGQIIGEASTSYLYTSGMTIDHMRSMYGRNTADVKIIAILRNPVERTYSHYLYLKKMGWEPLSFEDAIRSPVIESRIPKFKDYDYFEQGMYFKRVKSFTESFSNVRVYLFEDLKNLNELIKDIFLFLGVDPHVRIDTGFAVNPSGIPRSRFLMDMVLALNTVFKAIVPSKYSLQCIKIRDSLVRKMLIRPRMDQAIRSRLTEVFRDDIEHLQDLIGRDLSHWLDVKEQR